ncbi:MAG: glycosyltransferase [Erysipelotrichaceae bacterium]|nr:glycosyltransferase [Erysipelotrichaceae bacterium]
MKKQLLNIIEKIYSNLLRFIYTPELKIDLNESKKNLNSIYNYKQLNKEKIINKKINKKIDLSIIIPVYNNQVLVEKCLNSIINQKTKYNFEIICIDDGSTDKSLEILRKYEQKYSYLKVIHQENHGIAVARNVGINYSTGKYISFIDSDDFIDEKYIEILLNKAYSTNAEMVKCNYIEFSIEEQKIIKYGPNQAECELHESLKNDILKYKGFPWGSVMKRELWNDTRFPSGFWYEDMIMRMIIMRKLKNFVYINNCLYYYCNHTNNISKKVQKVNDVRCLDQLYLLQELLKVSKNDINEPISLYKNTLYELGVILWLRTKKLDKKIKKSAFIVACDIMDKLNDKEVVLNYNEKLFKRAFKTKNYLLWNLNAIDTMIKVKFNL